MKINFIFLTLLCLATSISTLAQDTILFMNGKIEIAAVQETDDISTVYTIKKNDKTKTKIKETTSIYGIIDSSGKLDTLYTPNPEKDLNLSQKEMYYFVLGEQDAKQYYKPNMTAIGGLVFGLGFGYLLHEGFYVAAVPMVYTVGAGVSKVKVTNIGNRSSEILTHPAYQEGFIKSARAKKSFYALGSSVIGTFAGAIIGHRQ